MVCLLFQPGPLTLSGSFTSVKFSLIDTFKYLLLMVTLVILMLSELDRWLVQRTYALTEPFTARGDTERDARLDMLRVAILLVAL